jgi:membrane protein DedA with SNARE-associated domain
VSPSKKANKPALAKPSKTARKKVKKSSMRSSGAKTTQAPASAPVLTEQEKHTKSKSTNIQKNALRVIALLAVIGITAYVFSIRDRVEEFAAFGYPGIFIIALLANATIFIPAPGVAIVYAMGAVFNPLLVGLSAGTGGAIGELSGYLAGFSGQAVVENTNVYDRIKPWVDKYGGWTILVLAAIPNPFFDVAGVAAGIAKMPMRTFLFFIWIGQLIKMTLFALAGRYSLEWIARFFE